MRLGSRFADVFLAVAHTFNPTARGLWPAEQGYRAEQDNESADDKKQVHPRILGPHDHVPNVAIVDVPRQSDISLTLRSTRHD